MSNTHVCVCVCLCVLPCSSLLCTWRAKQSQPRWAELWGSSAVCVTVETRSLEDDSHLKMFWNSHFRKQAPINPNFSSSPENKLLPETRPSAPKYSFQANRVWSIVPWWHQHWPSTSRRSAWKPLQIQTDTVFQKPDVFLKNFRFW